MKAQLKLLELAGDLMSELFSLLLRLVEAGLVIVAAYLIVRFTSSITKRTLSHVEQSFLAKILMVEKLIVYFIALITAISIISLETITMSILLGVLTLGLIVMFHDLLRNMGAEYYVRVYRPFKVGDWIELGGVSGKVIDISAFSTIIETSKGERVTIPHVYMLNNPILNKTTQSGIVAKFNIRVPFDVDPLEARRIICDIVGDVRGEFVDDPEIITSRTERNHIVFSVEAIVLNPAKIQYIRKHIEKELRKLWDHVEVY